MCHNNTSFLTIKTPLPPFPQNWQTKCFIASRFLHAVIWLAVWAVTHLFVIKSTVERGKIQLRSNYIFIQSNTINHSAVQLKHIQVSLFSCNNCDHFCVLLLWEIAALLMSTIHPLNIAGTVTNMVVLSVVWQVLLVLQTTCLSLPNRICCASGHVTIHTTHVDIVVPCHHCSKSHFHIWHLLNRSQNDS